MSRASYEPAPPSPAADSGEYPSVPPLDAPAHGHRSVVVSVALFTLTFCSTTYVGSFFGDDARPWYISGLSYSVPLMAILLAHELGHYVAARIHRVPASPPYFVPVPLPPLGTMGAVILMRGRIARRNALLDIGASGPLAGMCVALPVLVYGLLESQYGAPPAGDHWVEGHSLLYLGLLRLLKGPMPDGQDILLTPTAFAGWAGLMVTMINLLPAVQLDGGHVAYALFGERQERYSRLLRRCLLPLALLVGLAYGLPEWLAGKRGGDLEAGIAPAGQWLLWWVLLRVIAGRTGREHPRTDDAELSPRRRLVAWGTLVLFALLFMPAWLRASPGEPAAPAQPPSTVSAIHTPVLPQPE